MAARTGGLAIVVALMLAACSGGDDGGPAGLDVGAEAEQAIESGSGGGAGGGRLADSFGPADANGIGYTSDAVAASEQSGSTEAARPQTETRPPAPSGIGPSIIKTATVRVSIGGNDFSRGVHEATSVAERYGGYVVATTVDDEGKGFASATLRIPADRFGDALRAVRAVGTVQREEITGEDVTQQVIDLEARLRNLRAQEVVLLRLMDDAGSVLETIRIQEHLSDVQLATERLRGQLRYLDDQVAFSTIFVELRQAGTEAPKLGVLGRAWQRAMDGALSVVSGTIVAIGFALPFAMMLALAALALRHLWPRLRKVPSTG